MVEEVVMKVKVEPDFSEFDREAGKRATVGGGATGGGGGAGDLSNALEPLLNALQGISLKVAIALVIFRVIGEAIKPLMAMVDVLVSLLAALVQPFVNLLIPLLVPLLFILTPFVKALNLLLLPLLILMFQVFSKVGAILGEAAGALLTGDFRGFLDKLREAIIVLWNELIVPLGQAIFEFLIGLDWASIARLFIDAFIAGFAILQALWNLIWVAVKDIKIGDKTIEEWVDLAVTKLTELWDTLTGIWNFITQIFAPGEEGEGNPLAAFFLDPIGSILAGLGVVLSFIIEQFSPIVQSVFSELGSFLLTFFKKTFADIKVVLFETMIVIIETVVNAINSIISAYNETLGAIPGVPSIGKISAGGATGALAGGLLAARRESAEAARTIDKGINITINGDVTGKDLIEKVAKAIEANSRNDTTAIGFNTGVNSP